MMWPPVRFATAGITDPRVARKQPVEGYSVRYEFRVMKMGSKERNKREIPSHRPL